MEKNNLVTQLIDLSQYETNPFKKRAYLKASEIIAGMSREEFGARDNFKDIEGIGDAINKKIMQFKESGFITKWKELQNQPHAL